MDVSANFVCEARYFHCDAGRIPAQTDSFIQLSINGLPPAREQAFATSATLRTQKTVGFRRLLNVRRVAFFRLSFSPHNTQHHSLIIISPLHLKTISKYIFFFFDILHVLFTKYKSCNPRDHTFGVNRPGVTTFSYKCKTIVLCLQLLSL